MIRLNDQLKLAMAHVRPITSLTACLGALLCCLAYMTPAHASDDQQLFFIEAGHPEWTTSGGAAFGVKRRSPSLAAAIEAEDDDEPKKKRRKGRRVASLGPAGYTGDDVTKPKRSVAGGGGISWSASAGCLSGQLRSVLAEVAANYGSLRVNSTCRSRGHNRRVGGAPRSLHLSGQAADFRVFGNVGAVYAFLKGSSSVGGLKHYGGGLFHIDTGPRRSW